MSAQAGGLEEVFPLGARGLQCWRAPAGAPPHALRFAPALGSLPSGVPRTDLCCLRESPEAGGGARFQSMCQGPSLARGPLLPEPWLPTHHFFFVSLTRVFPQLGDDSVRERWMGFPRLSGS